MTDPALPAHSLAEAFLYVMAAPCPSCRMGPLTAGEAKRVAADVSGLIVHLPVRCGQCGHAVELRFALPDGPVVRGGEPAEVNPTDAPSLIIDLAQWVMLAHVIIEAAARETDKVRARHLGIEAAQCLDEALKFFEDDNDVPPAEAFFHESSRSQFREHPARFSRQRLVNRRSKLPAMSAMRSSLAPKAGKKKWWSWR